MDIIAILIITAIMLIYLIVKIVTFIKYRIRGFSNRKAWLFTIDGEPNNQPYSHL